MPEIGETVEYLGGTIKRINEIQFTTVKPNGLHYTTSHRIRSADSAFRSAVNQIRELVGAPVLPKLCTSCGVKPVYRSYAYCPDCAGVVTPHHRADINPDPLHVKSESEEPEEAVYEHTVYHLLRKGKDRADALIQRRGGVVPQDPAGL